MEKQTLAQFIFEKREKKGYSKIGLAKRCNLPVEVLDDIESGKELFLSHTVRQKLAKGLLITQKEIQELEKPADEIYIVSNDNIEEIRQKILDNDVKDLACPVCGSKLITRIAKMYDLYDNLVLHPKAKCEKCPFQIK